MLEICWSCKIMWKKKSARNHVVWSSHKIKLSTLQTRHYSRAERGEFSHTGEQVFSSRHAKALQVQWMALRKLHTLLCSMPWSDEQSQRPEPWSHQYRTLRWKTFKRLFDLFWLCSRQSVPEQTRKSETAMVTGKQNAGCRVVFTRGGVVVEIFAIYSDIQAHRRTLFPQKQGTSTLKKDQWTVIVLGFLRRVSFPVPHQLWRTFPMVGRTVSLHLQPSPSRIPSPVLCLRFSFDVRLPVQDEPIERSHADRCS